jgi:hypothetical protein
MVAAELTLTAEENACFELLMKVQAFAGKNTVLRVAGGWVRDKVRRTVASFGRIRDGTLSQVLGSTSHDIDIALDNVMGREFAESVKEYLSVRTSTDGVSGFHAICSLGERDVARWGQATGQSELARGLGIVKANPEQSKHLETATMRVRPQRSSPSAAPPTRALHARTPSTHAGTRSILVSGSSSAISSFRAAAVPWRLVLPWPVAAATAAAAAQALKQT